MSRTVKCQASRRDGVWVAHLPKYGVYGHGSTLKAVGENLQQGLALAGVAAQVVVTPTTPELERLHSAEATRTAALRAAVAALASQQATLSDIAAATGLSIRQAKEVRDGSGATRRRPASAST